MKRVKGKVMQSYVSYLGKNPNSKIDLIGKNIFPYVERLLNVEISDSDISYIMKRIDIDCGISSITKIILESDRKLRKTFMRIK